jgi:hypothetical protein
MPFTFSQTSGIIKSPSGAALYTGYSGRDAGRCNSALQHVRGLGPVPQGIYRKSREFECSRALETNQACEQCGGIGRHKHGPDVLRLTPVSAPSNPVYTDEQESIIARLSAAGDPQPWMFGRSGFLVHGDNALHMASEGCIIADHPTRVTLQQSPDLLEVKA